MGEGESCFIIAEAGADAVKFQTFKVENVVIENTEMVDY